jgi:hypothetical protein
MTLSGRRFACDAEDNVQLQMGGFKNEVKPNGDGSLRILKGRVAATVEGANMQYDFERGDVEFLQELRDGLDFFDYSATAVDGTIYSGSMQITDDLKFSFKEGTVGISLQGKVEKQG